MQPDGRCHTHKENSSKVTGHLTTNSLSERADLDGEEACRVAAATLDEPGEVVRAGLAELDVFFLVLDDASAGMSSERGSLIT